MTSLLDEIWRGLVCGSIGSDDAKETDDMIGHTLPPRRAEIDDRALHAGTFNGQHAEPVGEIGNGHVTGTQRILERGLAIVGSAI
jgi:hypothetical protein